MGAVRSLAGINDARVVGILASALKDRDANVRLTAAEVLGRPGDASVVPALIGALSDPAWRVAAKARESLAVVGAPAVPALVAVTGREATSPAAYCKAPWSRWCCCRAGVDSTPRKGNTTARQRASWRWAISATTAPCRCWSLKGSGVRVSTAAERALSGSSKVSRRLTATGALLPCGVALGLHIPATGQARPPLAGAFSSPHLQRQADLGLLLGSTTAGWVCLAAGDHHPPLGQPAERRWPAHRRRGHRRDARAPGLPHRLPWQGLPHRLPLRGAARWPCAAGSPGRLYWRARPA